MANLIVICGPQAVGKMTVAESIRDKLGYCLMTNHDSLEVSDRIFGFGKPAMKVLSNSIREKVFELAVENNIDLLFTYVCAIEMEEEKEYLKNLEKQFTESGGTFYFAELTADLDTRLERNETPHRLEMKPTKRNLEWSRNDLLKDTRNHKLNSDPDEIWFENHIKIDNSHLEPDETADRIIEMFGLKRSENS